MYPIPKTPKELEDRPLWRGRFPVPFTAWLNPKTNEYDLRVVEPERIAQCVQEDLCAACGKPMGEDKWFIGGTLCYVNHIFNDPAMHEGCARYALHTCPHLAVSKGRYTDFERAGFDTELVKEEKIGSNEKCETFMLGMTHRQDGVMLNGGLCVFAQHWLHTEWWSDRKQVPVPEKVAALAVKRLKKKDFVNQLD